ncbi:endocuticle structural glycoprotein SgAbd-3-like [Copidosoma floridanum]|uniref:endocuticle structural glycoprotein SgAbd-3-like n=1 Tax=Copidosoma floridanum TaxID=29053 RepID=UPI0006C9E372|nr:endocuticle structural glycoprotein SgAbd-3-like [Copidosoma floridanum]
MLLHCLLVICFMNVSTAQRRPLNPQQQPQRAPSAPLGSSSDANSEVISQISDISPDGSYYTKFETSNGIAFEEQGQPKSVDNQGVAEQVQGSASWTDNAGQRVSITWVADENGATFQGDHLPTSPPAPEIPPLIRRALEWIAANPPRPDEEGQYRDEDNYDRPLAATTARPTQQNLLQRRPPSRRF